MVVIDYQTDGWTGGFEFSYPWIRSRAENLYFSLGVGYKDLTSNILALEFTHDTMTMIVAGAEYDTHDKWGGLIQAAVGS